MQIVGIHSAGHDTGVCLWRDGSLVYSIETERLTRRRHDHAVAAALEALRSVPGFDPAAIDLVAVSTVFRQSLVRVAEPEAAREAVRRGELHYNTTCDLFGITLPCVVVAHEASHAALALHYSGYDEPAAILVNEGRGSFSCNSVFHYREGRLTLEAIDPLPWYASGFGWSGVGYLLGYGRGPSVAGKVMALGGFGEPKPALIDAVLEVDRRVIDHGSDREAIGARLLARLDDPSDFHQRASLVSSLQHVFSDAVLALLRYHLELAGARRIALGGGCALNIVTNSRIRSELGAPVAIPPACNDSGQALGAAIYAQKFVLGTDPAPLQVYSNGRAESTEAICRTLAHAGITGWRDYDAGRVAAQIADGAIVAFLQGAAELGPRALGHRSLLAHPAREGTKRRVSDRLKGREWFRPLAPVVREERFAELRPGEPHSPYMLFNYAATKLAMPEATHVDGTARVQTVAAGMNPRLHALLRAFEAGSGENGLVNTSLNAGGRPIVQTARDLLDDFWKTEVEVFVLGDVMVERKRAAERST